jgi:shikimate kinase
MRVIFLYGPPASGKLTVARALGERIGAAVYHHHVSLDYASTLFESGTAEFGALVEKLRLETFAFCAKQDRDLIFTYVYAHPHDEPFVRRTITAVQGCDGEVLFVQLDAPDEVLLERVEHDSRRAFEKLNDRQTLEPVLKKYDLHKHIPFVESLRLSTADFEPEEAATAIIEFFELEEKEGS